VRTASIYLEGGPLLDAPARELAAFDLIVLPVEAQVWNKSFFKTVRAFNQDIIILPYVATVSWNDAYWVDSLHAQMKKDIKSDWWLKDGNGRQVSVWPNTRALNLSTGWTDYLARHVRDVVLASGYWDGVFFDEVQDSISWVGAVDVDADGSQDAARTADTLWAQNYERLFATTRELVGDNYIIITNGSSNHDFFPYVNGRMFETFPSSHQTLAHWGQMTREYLAVERGTAPHSVVMINVNTDNTLGAGSREDYRAVRFGLATTLLGNGYFSYDEGTNNHATLWSYDEFGAYLGAPKSDRQNVFNPQQTTIDPGVWLREFEEGQVIVNATAQARTVDLDGEFEKLHGEQDPVVNDGRIVSEVTLAAQDGVFLLRPIQEIVGATFVNGAFARVYNLDGTTKRTGFFAYDNTQRGGRQVIRFDLDGDGVLETVSADDSRVSIFGADDALRANFAPYAQSYNRGVNIAVGDLEGDGSVEIITGTQNGGGPHVRVFDAHGALINPGFFAYADSFRGGVNVAVGDLNGDGIKDVVTGPGRGGSPLARVYDRDGTLKGEFFVFDSTDRDGLDVVAADLDGDGRAEIIGLSADVFTLSVF
jgi:hypothetical protein